MYSFFFFQAEDGIRDVAVTGVQTCALPISGEAGQGVRMVRDNLAKTLREAGLHEIPALGRPFDPYQMDAVEHVTEKDSKDGFVKKVLRKGYRLHDRVLRPAQVIVA